MPWAVRRRYRQNPALYREISVELEDQGVQIRTPNTTSNWKWTELLGFRENREIFLLSLSNSVGYVLPKRVLSDGDAHQLADLLKSKLKRLS